MAFSVLVAGFVSNALPGSYFKMIDTAGVHSMIVDNAYRLEGGRAKQFAVIDARTNEEYEEAHIFSAISVPEEDFEKSMVLLPKDRDELLIVYGNDAKFETSRRWAGKAAAAGYTNIVIYTEGFSVWMKRALPVAPLKKKEELS